MTETEYERLTVIALDIVQRGLDLPENPTPLETELIEGIRSQAEIWQQPGISERERGKSLLDNVNGTSRAVLRLVKGG